jgi:hypothetical protein
MGRSTSTEETGPLPAAGGSGTNTRALIVVMYLFFTAAGVACFFAPSRAVAGQVAPTLTILWASFFFVGGLVCLLGSISGVWWGELLGLPLIASSSFIYGSALLIQYGSTLDTPRRDGAYLFVGLLLLAQGGSIIERWVSRWRLLRVAQRITNREAG